MKQYVIDQIHVGDAGRIRDELDRRYGAATLGAIWWIPVPEALHTAAQAEHVDCQPHYIAVEFDETRLSAEFLVRTRTTMKCECMGYATPSQRAWILDTVDELFLDLGIVI